MTAPVSGLGNATYTATSQIDRGDQLGKDTFLKLLVAQMRYQDPSNPADSTQLMSQTASFSQVEKLEEIAKQSASALILQEHTTAAAMVGRTVTYTDSEGAEKTGRVSSVRLATIGAEATATVDGVDVPVGRITQIAT